MRFVAGRLWERRADAPLLSARLAGRVLLRGLTRVDGLSSSVDPTSRSPLAASVLTSGLVALTSGLVAVAPESQRGVVQPTGGEASHEPSAAATSEAAEKVAA